MPEQAQSDPWPSLQRLARRIDGAQVEHEQDQSRPYSGLLQWHGEVGGSLSAPVVRPDLTNGVLMAATMHELTALLFALRLDCHRVAIWLGDRFPMDIEGYRWFIGTGPAPAAVADQPHYVQWHPGEVIDEAWLQLRGIVA